MSLIGSGLSLALMLQAGLAQAQAKAEAMCDGPLMQLLQPQLQTRSGLAEPIPARAYWLDRSQLQWPGQGEPAGSRFKLYRSAVGALQVRVGEPVQGADEVVALQRSEAPLAQDLAERFKFIAAGPRLSVAVDGLDAQSTSAKLAALLQAQVLLVQEDAAGRVLAYTALQTPGALDDLYASAADLPDLGLSVGAAQTQFKLWAPTAQAVSLCRYANGSAKAMAVQAMRWEGGTGTWSLSLPADLSGQYYRYAVQVWVPGLGLVRNLVTDPYSLSLSQDSARSLVVDLQSPRLKPAGWDAQAHASARVKNATDMVVYELHVRDFSIGDRTVPRAKRGKYLAFTEGESNGMRHLRALADAGLTDVHLLPVFDIATIPEAGCKTPQVPKAAADSPAQQAAVMALAGQDCFNWGYDPWHYSAPEGSYASSAMQGERRIIEFRQMVQALHKMGLRVGMDVVYNHTAASGQNARSVLDRIVPGYYQRLNASGEVEQSTCCANTATEHRMMAKLMLDSVALWAREYRIDSFRFDLMAHQPRAVMEALQARVNAAAGRPVQLMGEGWNFGEVADGARFVQASQLSLNGSGIATFSDRARDAARGGSAGDGGVAVLQNQGWLNGLLTAPNAQAAKAPARPTSDLLKAADLLRVGLAGSLRDYRLQTWQDQTLRLDEIDYAGQPAGYVAQPGEVVNYVENHDNQTLFDIHALKLPQATSSVERARVQVLGAALTAFSQGIAYFHAGIDVLRSKSLDRNSYDSGDWFNRLDWTYRDNGFGAGLPPQADNGAMFEWMKPLLADPAIKPRPQDIAWTRDAFRDLLKIRASSSLFRLPTAAAVQQRLVFHNTGSAQNPLVLAASLDGQGWPGAGFKGLLYFINAAEQAQTLSLPALAGRAYGLHPVHLAPAAADSRPAAQARYERASGQFTLPARTALVFVEALD
ncbi:pullulanase-type alpha-1,6-glucosidase [Paucibacter sp. KCTC 42545]|uniref:pullulanase-type alpha-1,6-glucosidase n=1 Tax=Paucibacter sp. KCTC 42545 TaxID=1768242 RepID=UPI002FF99F40